MSEVSGEAAGTGDWAVIRVEYENRIGTLEELATRHGVTRAAICWRARRDCWRGRNRAVGSSEPALKVRLLRLIERQLFHLEQETGKMSEKDIAVMGRLAATLEKVMAGETKIRSKAPPRQPPREMRDLRDKLMARIERLSRG
ncbi:MAG TPA: hypothetical protein VGN80_07595 [Devosiaceae bacterium]|nr:hypothetical protein [Devosiaceae bacterium]